MKNLKLFALVAVATLIFFACDDNKGDDDNNNSSNTPTCQCPDLDEHWLTCEEYGCKIGGHEQKPRAEITEPATEKYPEGRKIPIYQTKCVTDEEAIAIAPKIVKGYDSAHSVLKTTLAEDEFMQEIRIRVGGGSPTADCTADGLVTVGTDRKDDDISWTNIFHINIWNKYNEGKCACNPKAHLGIDETCTCGGTRCDCTLQNYNTENVIGIPIYKHSSVTQEQIDIAITTLVEKLYDTSAGGMTSTQKSKFEIKITEIHVGETDTEIKHTNGILDIPYDVDINDLGSYLHNNGLLS